MHAGRDVDVVDVRPPLDLGDDVAHLVDFQIARPERGRVDAVADEPVVAGGSPHPLQCLEGEAQAVLLRAAPAVGPLVVERRDELPGQVAVAQMKLDPVEPRRERADRGAAKGLQQLLDLVLIQLLGRGRAGEFAQGHLARRDGVPGLIGVVGGLLLEGGEAAHARVPELDRELAALLVDRVGDFRQRLDLPIVEELRHQQRRHEGAAVDMGPADDDEADSALGTLPVIVGRHVDEEPVPRVGDPARAGRREHHPILDRGVANLPFREKPWIGRHVALSLSRAPVRRQ